MAIQLSYTATIILQAIANGYVYGFDIMDLTGLPSGTVYPALRRLYDADLVAARWEKHEIALHESRPPRKYYLLTKEGETALTDALTRYRLLEADRRLPARPGRPIGERS